MTKVLAYLCAILLAVSAWSLHAYKQQNAKLAAQAVVLQTAVRGLEQASAAQKSSDRALATRRAENAVQARKLAQTQAALQEALQRNKLWSDTDVPLEVQEALAGPRSVPEGASHGRAGGLPGDSGGVSEPAPGATGHQAPASR